MKNLNYCILFLLCIIFVSISCNKEEGTEEPNNDDNNPPPPLSGLLDSKTITPGTEGGNFKIDQFYIAIPQNTFTTSESMTVEVYADLRYPDDQNSHMLRIKNIPKELSQPFQVKIGGVAASDESVIGIEFPSYSKSQDKEGTFLRIEMGEQIGDTLVYTFEPTVESGNLKTTTDNSPTFQIDMYSMTGYGWVYSPNKLFLFSVYQGEANSAMLLASDLEDFYYQLVMSPYNYDVSRRTNYPIRVDLRKYVYDKEMDGGAIPGVLGVNYIYLSLNTDPQVHPNYQTLKRTAFHEFFHLVQYLYDPRKSQLLRTDALWFDEATATYMEGLASSDFENYFPSVMETDIDAPLRGLFAGGYKDDGSTRWGEHGYGMASMIKFLVNRNGKDFIKSTYEEIFKKEKIFSALKSSLINVEYKSWYYHYLKALLTGQVYGQEATTKILNSPSVIKTWKPERVDEKIKYDVSMSKMGAKIIKINTSLLKGKLNNLSTIKISCGVPGGQSWAEDLKVMMIKKKGGTVSGPAYLHYEATGTTSFRIDDINHLTENNNLIYIVLVDLSEDFQNEFAMGASYSIEMEVIEERPLEYKFEGFDFGIYGAFEGNYEDSTWYGEDQFTGAAVPDGEFDMVKVSSTHYTCTFDITNHPWSDVTYHWVGSMSIQLSEDLGQVDQFTVNMDYSYTASDQQGNDVYSLTVNNIPYSMFDNIYMIEGSDVPSHVSNYSSYSTVTLYNTSWDNRWIDVWTGNFRYLGPATLPQNIPLWIKIGMVKEQ